MKKRQPAAGKSRKTRQKRVPKMNPLIHEWDRRLRQAGYIIPCPRKSHTIPERIAAALAVVGIAALTTLAAYAVHLPDNQPNPWHDQGTPTARK